MKPRGWHSPRYRQFLLKEPSLQPSPGAAKANQHPAVALGVMPSSCWSTYWGHLRPQEMAPGVPASLGNNAPHAGTGDGPSQSQQSPQDPIFAEETLDARPNALAAAVGICPDNGGTAAPAQGQADEQAQRSLFNAHNKASRLPACRLTRHLFTFPASWTLSWSLSQLGGNNLPSYLTQKDSQLSAHKHGLCLSLNESSVN